jgi:nucleotide-binding universal stress UspA family protein
MHIAIAVDGSPVSTRAVRHAIKLAGQLAEPPQITIITASPPMLPGVDRKLGADAVARYHDQNATFALRGARAALRRADLAFEEHVEVGFAAETVIRHCNRIKADLLVMGSRGRGAVRSAFLGSDAIKVRAGSRIPVTIVR